MDIVKTIQYERTSKKLIKKYILSQEQIDNTLILFQENINHNTLQYKKMTCKKDKNRYSIRVINTKYRILMTSIENKHILVCVCDHDDYDYRNKNC